MKTEVYSWRLPNELKAELERKARSRKVPVSRFWIWPSATGSSRTIATPRATRRNANFTIRQPATLEFSRPQSASRRECARNAPRAPFVRSGALVVGAIDHGELPYLHALMSRDWDRPMDFADATVVYLAKRESLSVILTLDQGDFATYRIEGKRQFRVLLVRRP
jgi:hypothetical protein